MQNIQLVYHWDHLECAMNITRQFVNSFSPSVNQTTLKLISYLMKQRDHLIAMLRLLVQENYSF